MNCLCLQEVLGGLMDEGDCTFMNCQKKATKSYYIRQHFVIRRGVGCTPRVPSRIAEASRAAEQVAAGAGNGASISVRIGIRRAARHSQPVRRGNRMFNSFGGSQKNIEGGNYEQPLSSLPYMLALLIGLIPFSAKRFRKGPRHLRPLVTSSG